MNLVALPDPDKTQAAVEAIKRSLPATLELMRLLAKVQKASFDALIAEGFTEAQALQLCKRMTE